MCDDGERLPETFSAYKCENQSCKKCKTSSSVVVLRGSDTYCKDCFLQTATHRFRATLGKSRLLRPGLKVLIAFSGGKCSSALLHLVKTGLTQDTHKKLQFDPIILHIDQSPYIDQVSTNEVIEIMQKTEIPYQIIKLCQALSEEISFSSLDNENNLNNDLTNMLAKIHTQTAKQDFIDKLRYNLIASVAHKLNCTLVFLGDICTSLASKLLSSIALGRGAHLSLEVGFCDDRFKNIKILRPMRDFIEDEVLYYNRFYNISSNENQDILNTINIQDLTKKFVNDLQQNYPATVYAISSSGHKINQSSKLLIQCDPCMICNAALDTNLSNATALRATKFSRSISSLGPSSFNMNNQDDLKLADIYEEECEKFLCYGCRLLVRNMDLKEKSSFYEVFCKLKSKYK